MMYGMIAAAEHSLVTFDAPDYVKALRMCGLNPGQVDHGHIKKITDERGTMLGGIAIVVDEYGLRRPPLNQHYFGIGRRLYAGNGLLYMFDAYGTTVDYIDADGDVSPAWFAGAQDVERAIEAGDIIRPFRAVNGRIEWEWPS